MTLDKFSSLQPSAFSVSETDNFLNSALSDAVEILIYSQLLTQLFY